MLQPGGIARIAVPDGELYCRRYIQALTSDIVDWPYPEPGKTPIYYLNRIMRDHGHCFIYDFESLKQAMLAAGFREVQRTDYRQGRDPSLLVDQEYRRVETLYVEGLV